MGEPGVCVYLCRSNEGVVFQFGVHWAEFACGRRHRGTIGHHVAPRIASRPVGGINQPKANTGRIQIQPECGVFHRHVYVQEMSIQKLYVLRGTNPIGGRTRNDFRIVFGLRKELENVIGLRRNIIQYKNNTKTIQNNTKYINSCCVHRIKTNIIKYIKNTMIIVINDVPQI